MQKTLYLVEARMYPRGPWVPRLEMFFTHKSAKIFMAAAKQRARVNGFLSAEYHIVPFDRRKGK